MSNELVDSLASQSRFSFGLEVDQQADLFARQVQSRYEVEVLHGTSGFLAYIQRTQEWHVVKAQAQRVLNLPDDVYLLQQNSTFQRSLKQSCH